VGVEDDTALVWSNSHVTALAPRGAPGVLDEEVLTLRRVSAIADNGDGVVKIGAAARSDDAASVASETSVLSLNSDRQDMGVESEFQLVSISRNSRVRLNVILVLR